MFYLFSDFGNISQRQLFREVMEEIEYGEELGFDSAWLAEHHFARKPREYLRLNSWDPEAKERGSL